MDLNVPIRAIVSERCPSHYWQNTYKSHVIEILLLNLFIIYFLLLNFITKTTCDQICLYTTKTSEVSPDNCVHRYIQMQHLEKVVFLSECRLSHITWWEVNGSNS
jgi:hypothetical protein